MHLTLDHWHVRYRLPGGSPPAPHRLESARRAALDACAAALDQVLDADTTVYVLRDLTTTFSVNLGSHLPDAELAQRWGTRLATDIGHALLSPHSSAEVATFASLADYLAEFLSAFARGGDPTGDWRFSPLADLSRSTLGETAQVVFEQHRPSTPSLLAHLHRLGASARVLATLPLRVAHAIWCEGLPGQRRHDPESERPLFSVAVNLMREAGWLVATAGEHWFATYAATDPPSSNWKTATELTDGVLRAVRFIIRQKWAVPRHDSLADLRAIDGVLDRLDWLDTRRLLDELDQPIVETTAPAAPRRSIAALASPMTHAVRAALTAFPTVPPTPAGNLLVYSAIVADHADWSDDPALPLLVEQALRERARPVNRLAPPSAPTLSSRTALAERDWGTSPSPDRTPATGSMPASTPSPDTTSVTALPAPVSVMDTGFIPGISAASLTSFDSPVAGVALLWRAVLDLRLAAVCKHLDYPPGPRPLSLLLAELAMRWAGLPASARVDPAIALLAGLDPGQDTHRLPSICPERHRDFQMALVRLAWGHRLLATPLEVCIGWHETATGPVLLAGQEESRLWLLAEPVASPREAQPVLARWLDSFHDITGQTPSLTVPLALEAVAPAGATLVEPCLPDTLKAALPVREPANLTLSLAADLVVRAWARWLRRFERASTPFLLEQLIRRPGWLLRLADGWLVELAPRPLDPVLRLAGYTAPLERVAWLDGATIHFTLRGE